MSRARYIHCSAADVPADLRWDVAAATAGKPIEVAHGGPADAGPYEDGAPWKRVRNLATGDSPTYFRLDQAGGELEETAWRARQAADAKGRSKRGGR